MQSLFSRLLFNVYYYLFFVAYYILTRLFFLVYHADFAKDLSFTTLAMIPVKGLNLDFPTASYFSLIPFLIIVFSIWLPNRITKGILNGYTFTILFIINILFLFDIGLYKAWGMRLDATPLMYLNTPKEMLASVSTPLLIGASIFWIGFSLLLFYIFNRTISKRIAAFKPLKFWYLPVLLFPIVLLGIVGRGGLQTVPVNQSSVYFSDQMFANHAAVNFTWSFINGLSNKGYNQENSFKVKEIAVANAEIKASMKPLKVSLSNDSLKLLTTDQPNVILILWESLTAKIVEPLGGEKNVTPYFNQLVKEGILFSQFYANGDRSDKGLVAVMSGYPPQPDQSIIKNTNKASSLPFLTKELNNIGYSNSFYYGGDLNFGNMITYLRSGAVNELISGDDFDKKDWNSKWGVHDHVLLNRFLADINKEKNRPFFKTLFTLSSHEPFEFPGDYAFGKDGDENLFKSAHHYTDKSIGEFIEAAKNQPWWENTLVVIMADHGHPLPSREGFFHGPSKFHIPMLWLGGALAKKDTVIDHISSQTDFAYTLLPMLGGDHSAFIWGKNIFATNKTHFAHYVYNKGFGVISNEGTVVYDYIQKENIVAEGNHLNDLKELGLSITQQSYQDYLDRK